MAKIVLNKLSTETWVLDDKAHYILGEKGVLDVDADGAEGYGHGIFTGGGSGGPAGSIIDILGRITVSLDNHVGIFAQNDDITIRVAETGRVRADTGININAMGSHIENHGSIRGVSDGVKYYQGMADLVNAEDGVIRGVVGVRLSEEGGTIVNRGKIIGESMSVYSHSGEGIELRNFGYLGGDVVLEEGDDLFVNNGGTVDGVVKGGLGHDVYRIVSGDVEIFEALGEGVDTLQIKRSYSLTDSVAIEILQALGTGDFDLAGNGLSNRVIGNAGNNVLHGLGGKDIISGFGGNDKLWGGDAGDTFNFMKGWGKDVIGDFETGVDRINLEQYEGITGVDDLHMFQVGDNVVIELLGKDKIILLDQDGVNTDDFLFPVV
ncbi:calcium-binding protein [Rhizobium sp. LjRoot254]|uniref:calcium-binding protein n=1 Tax=Rhizobium sp. LjRoot254 TaxID=3342297 RepID=UPI003ECC5BB9